MLFKKGYRSRTARYNSNLLYNEKIVSVNLKKKQHLSVFVISFFNWSWCVCDFVSARTCTRIYKVAYQYLFKANEDQYLAVDWIMEPYLFNKDFFVVAFLSFVLKLTIYKVIHGP